MRIRLTTLALMIFCALPLHAEDRTLATAAGETAEEINLHKLSREEFLQHLHKAVPAFYVSYAETIQEREARDPWWLSSAGELVYPAGPIITVTTYEDFLTSDQASRYLNEIKRRHLDDHLIRMNVSGILSSEEFLAKMAELSNLQQLFLTRTRTDMTGLAAIPEMKALTHFRYHPSVSSVEEVEQIAQSSTIENLSLYVPIESEHTAAELIRPLRKMPSLRHLSVGGRIDVAGLEVLAQIPFLESLEVENLVIPRDGLACLKSMRFLKHFSSKGLHTRDEDEMEDSYSYRTVENRFPSNIECVNYAHLNQIPTLQSLLLSNHLRDDQIPRYGLSELTQIREIQNCPRLQEPLASELQQLSELESVKFGANRKQYKSLEFTRYLPHLKSMEISWSYTPASELTPFVKFLSEHSSLQELHLSCDWKKSNADDKVAAEDHGLVRTVVDELSRLPELRTLSFTSRDLTDREKTLFFMLTDGDKPIKISDRWQ